jgi:hypothetical protein
VINTVGAGSGGRAGMAAGPEKVIIRVNKRIVALFMVFVLVVKY